MYDLLNVFCFYADYIVFVASNLSWTQDWFDWNTSLSLCRDIYGTDLASFHSSNDIESYLSLINSTNNNSGMNQFENHDCWIGLIDKIGNNINYSWTDDTPFDFSYWHTNSPNNYNNNMTQKESCVRFTRMSLNRHIPNVIDYNLSTTGNNNNSSSSSNNMENIGAKWDDFSCNGGFSTENMNSVATCAVCRAKATTTTTTTTTTVTTTTTATTATTTTTTITPQTSGIDTSSAESTTSQTTIARSETTTDTTGAHNAQQNITTPGMFAQYFYVQCMRKTKNK